jgi:pimeloyl-ACP methyl ester carboxylesterase
MTESCRCAAGGASIRLTPDVSACGAATGGPAVLCLPPGPGFGHQIIRSLGAALAPGLRPLLVDYPGHGGAGASLAGRDGLVGLLAEAVAAAGDPVLLGHSWGADIALSVAARRPPAALILLSPPPTVQRPAGWTAGSGVLRKAVSPGAGPDGWFRRYLLDYALPLGLDGDQARAADLLAGVPTYDRPWRALRRQADPEPVPARLARLRTPTLVLYGMDDALLAPGELAEAGELDHVRVRGLPGGHYLYLDNPDDTRTAVAGFVHEVSTRRDQEATYVDR